MADSTRIGAIHVDMGLSTAQFSKGVQSAKREAAGLGASLKSSLGGLTKEFGLGLAGGFTAALAPMALFQTALKTINDASHLVDTADKIGITTTALQELGFGFSQAGVEATTFETSMMQFSKRIGEAAVHGGRLADILKANGVAIRDANGQIRSSEDLLADYAELVRNAASEQEKMLLVTEAFGRGGGDMLNGLNQGAQGIKNMKAAAEEAGGVIDEKLLRRAEEMGDRWEAAWRRFTVNSQSAILTAIEGMDSLNDRMKRFLENRNAVEAGALAGSLAGSRPSGKGGRLGSVDERINQAFLGELVKADDALIEQLRKRYAKATIIPATGGSSGGGGKEKADAFKPEADAFRNMLGYTKEYVEAQEIANQRIEEFGDLAVGAANSLATALADGKLEANELLTIFIQMAQQLMSMKGLGGAGGILSSLFGGGGGFNPTSGGFASMLGIPGRASGGPVAAGQPYIVGEKRPELFIPNTAGRIVPRVPSVSAGGGGSSSVVELRLSPELTAQILAEAKGQSIRISQDSTARGLAAYDAGKQRQQMTSG